MYSYTVKQHQNTTAILTIFKQNKIIKKYKNIDYLQLKNILDLLQILNINQK